MVTEKYQKNHYFSEFYSKCNLLWQNNKNFASKNVTDVKTTKPNKILF